MISIRNLNSYALPSAAQTATKKTSTENTASKKPLVDETIPSKLSLKQYAEIAEEKTYNPKTMQATQAIVKKDNLSFSTLSAINQYTRNASLAQTEKTNAILGLSVYA